MDRWLSVDEIAKYLGVGRETVYKWIPRRQLPSHKVGKLWNFKLKEVDEWVRINGKTAAVVQDENSTQKRHR